MVELSAAGKRAPKPPEISRPPASKRLRVGSQPQTAAGSSARQLAPFQIASPGALGADGRERSEMPSQAPIASPWDGKAGPLEGLFNEEPASGTLSVGGCQTHQRLE